MNERIMISDDAERAAALDVSRSFVVHAPAGSGKTELLIQRYLALLSRVERPEAIVPGGCCRESQDRDDPVTRA